MKYFRKKSLIFAIILVGWSFFYKDFFIYAVSEIKEAVAFLPLSLDDKFRIADGQLYDYIKFVQSQVPEDADVFYINVTRYFLKGSAKWLKNERDRERIRYFLYPRKLIEVEPSYQKIDTYRIVYRIDDEKRIFLKLYSPGEKRDDIN